MITLENVAAVAKLSKIKLTPEDQDKFRRQLNNIFKIIENLRHVDITGVEPLYLPIELSNVFRDESKTESTLEILLKEALREDILKSSKYYENGKITVPQVVK